MDTIYLKVRNSLPTRLLRSLTRLKHRARLPAYHRSLDRLRDEGIRIVHFLHVGKTGGTAIKDALRRSTPPQDTVLHLHDHEFILRDIPRADSVIFALRDPVARFVSGFNSRFREGRPRHNIPWTRDEREAFGRFPTPEELASSIYHSDPSVANRAVHAMRSIQHVSSPYSEWFESIDYVRTRADSILFAAFQESLNEDFQILRSMLGLPDSVVLPSDPVRSHRTPQQAERQLSEIAEANLRRWYADDYDFLEFFRKWRASDSLQSVSGSSLIDPLR